MARIRQLLVDDRQRKGRSYPCPSCLKRSLNPPWYNHKHLPRKLRYNPHTRSMDSWRVGCVNGSRRLGKRLCAMTARRNRRKDRNGRNLQNHRHGQRHAVLFYLPGSQAGVFGLQYGNERGTNLLLLLSEPSLYHQPIWITRSGTEVPSREERWSDPP